jgi:hypothetical protein
VGSLNGRAKRLEQRHGVGGEIDEEARRRRAQEALDEIRARMQRIIVEESGHAPDDLTPQDDEDGTLRELYEEVFGYEVSDEEWQLRERLIARYGAVSLAPTSEQQKLRRF